MFESLGMLCRHALRVINVKNITQILAQYILKRWTKDAKKDSASHKYATSSSMSREMSMTLRHNELLRLVYDIFSKSAATTRHTAMCKMKVKEMVELIEKDMANLNIERVFDANNDGLIDESETTTNGDGLMKISHDDLPILDPPYVRQKGITNKRIKYNLEKRKQRAPKDVTRSSKYF